MSFVTSFSVTFVVCPSTVLFRITLILSGRFPSWLFESSHVFVPEIFIFVTLVFFTVQNSGSPSATVASFSVGSSSYPSGAFVSLILYFPGSNFPETASPFASVFNVKVDPSFTFVIKNSALGSFVCISFSSTLKILIFWVKSPWPPPPASELLNQASSGSFFWVLRNVALFLNISCGTYVDLYSTRYCLPFISPNFLLKSKVNLVLLSEKCKISFKSLYL